MIYLERKERVQYLVSLRPDPSGEQSATGVRIGRPAGDDLRRLGESAWWGEYPYPVVVDADSALRIMARDDARSDTLTAEALHQSRLSLTGTDGLRGKTRADLAISGIEAIRQYFAFQILTPGLLAIAAEAYYCMAAESESCVASSKSNMQVMVGNDGRDRASAWRLLAAVQHGFRRAGASLLNLGVVPTPYVPWLMLREAVPLGAMLTASHNPADQNGIKFFYRGRKLLPEGPMGEYALSAWMLALAHGYNGTAFGCPQADLDTWPSASLEALASLTLQSLPDDLGSVLREERLVLDSANGAFHGLAAAVLDKLNLRWSTINREPDGSNINQACGVAEIEGQHELGLPAAAEPSAELSAEPSAATAYTAILPTARPRAGTPLTAALACPDSAWAIVLDGDGDRGFLVRKHAGAGNAVVYDGDDLGFVLAGAAVRSGSATSDSFVTLSVESDLMCAQATEGQLGLKTRILGVGDKWIAHEDDGNLLVGLEASGHVIVPLELVGKDGRTSRLLTGNGLRASLLALYHLVGQSAAEDKHVTMFPRGFGITKPVYFVDKTRFQSGGLLWKASLAWMESLELPGGLAARPVPMSDSGLLYWDIHAEGRKVASLFARNSGTEDKHAIYLKCETALSGSLVPVAETLWLRHYEALKAEDRAENQLARGLLSRLDREGPLPDGSGGDIVCGVNMAQQSLLPTVLYGLRKEGLMCLNSRQHPELTDLGRIMLQRTGYTPYSLGMR